MVTASDAATSANDNHGGIWGIPRPRVGCRVRGRGAGQAGTGDPLSTSGRISGLVIGSAGWITEFEPNGFTTVTLGGKEVYVGTIEMLDQSECSTSPSTSGAGPAGMSWTPRRWSSWSRKRRLGD
jgi:hypothetical protein